MPTPTKQTRVREASDEQAISIARRGLSCGYFFVEQFSLFTWSTKERPTGQWNCCSSHMTLEAAEAAKAKLDRKLARQGLTD